MNYKIDTEKKFVNQVENLIKQYRDDDVVKPLRGLKEVLRSNPHHGKLASGKDNLGVVPLWIKGDKYMVFYTFDGTTIKLRSISPR